MQSIGQIPNWIRPEVRFESALHDPERDRTTEDPNARSQDDQNQPDQNQNPSHVRISLIYWHVLCHNYRHGDQH